MTEQPPAEAEALSALFAPQVDDPAVAAALRARLEEFDQAIAAGGGREEYRRWQASRSALQAALDILGA
ncbi:hypothetical protein [Pseudothauera rhizosphaerae]|uniref:Uncharacterized protein n=1 Tax=Pseudothauera rhizosphaerae TaxID=2565932 RepID=A0A4S4ADV2_9RHOO|nr:hypothetical protein [Pseudothauera rhizosphaerae]THF57253.1 hypothetical protein E6O51_18320 [Pseudothauera rhizosphaerae]